MIILYFIILISSFIQSSTKLLYVSQLYRHGARYAYHDFYDFNQTKQFLGTLTSIGLRQHYLLGSYLKNQYIQKTENIQNLLSSPLNSRQIQLFTLLTQPKRCEQSAYAQALGLFPYYEGPLIPQNINSKLLQPPFQTISPQKLRSQNQESNFALDYGFQPIPIREGTSFFPKCSNEQQIMKRRMELINSQMRQLQQEQRPFIIHMQNIFNLTLNQTNLYGLKDLADVIISDKWLDRKFPDQFTQQNYNRLYFIRSYQMTNQYSGQVAQIYNEPFIRTLIQNMKNKIQGKLYNKKFSSYSTRDLNIIPLMVYYNLTSATCQKVKFNNRSQFQGICNDPIPFASNLIFELHQREQLEKKQKNIPNQYFVKVRYNGVYYQIFDKTQNEIQFYQFAEKSLQHLMDFEKQCQSPHPLQDQKIVKELFQ